jgi:serine/threonine-protein kinase HipA
MNRELDVYLFDLLVGHLTQDKLGDIAFSYEPTATAISISLPVREEPFTSKACKGFFAGILPEQRPRELIAKNLGISVKNDFAMLREIGGECAGAITFLAPGDPFPRGEDVHNYRELSEAKLAEILKELPQRPLLAGESGVRLSLAGAQNKLAVCIIEDQVALPLGNSPSTHVIKLPVPGIEGSVENEHLCMELARSVGLPAAVTQIRRAQDMDYLLAERYDRRILPPSSERQVRRLHQEDFCQALGLTPDQKYENEGGPSLAECFELLRNVSAVPAVDLQRLLNAVIFNFLIGNNDAHGKNFSLLYELHQPLAIRFAPLYDVMCTAIYPDLSKKMAMRIGSVYESDKVLPRHFQSLAESAGLSGPLILERLGLLAGKTLSAVGQMTRQDPVANRIADYVSARCRKVIERLRR